MNPSSSPAVARIAPLPRRSVTDGKGKSSSPPIRGSHDRSLCPRVRSTLRQGCAPRRMRGCVLAPWFFRFPFTTTLLCRLFPISGSVESVKDGATCATWRPTQRLSCLFSPSWVAAAETNAASRLPTPAQLTCSSPSTAVSAMGAPHRRPSHRTSARGGVLPAAPGGQAEAVKR